MPLRHDALSDLHVGESTDAPSSGGAIRPIPSSRRSSRRSPYGRDGSPILRVRLPPIRQQGASSSLVVAPPPTTGLSGEIGDIALQTPDGPISSRTRRRFPLEAAEAEEGSGGGSAASRPSPSPSKLRRLSAGVSTSANPAMLNKFYSEESLRRRYALMQHPRIVEALDRLWAAANTDDTDQVLDQAEYQVMHRKLVLALDPSTPPSEAVEIAEEDWGRDSEGEEGLDKDRFCWCWFELADLWTESMEAAEYETFLTRTMSMITTTDSKGRVMWRDDKEVMRQHFKLQRERGVRISATESLPVVMATWHAFEQREKRQRAERRRQAEEAEARRREVARKKSNPNPNPNPNPSPSPSPSPNPSPSPDPNPSPNPM
jgi:hypothetical protein